jgi:hypothetical protein
MMKMGKVGRLEVEDIVGNDDIPEPQHPSINFDHGGCACDWDDWDGDGFFGNHQDWVFAFL